MQILAVDTSSRAASCALWADGVLVGEYFSNAGLTHSQTIIPMVQSLLRDAGVTPGEIDRFAVSAGPGSFTGLRIGLSAVKGMAMAWDKPCVAVSTLEGLAQNLAVFDGYIAPVMDARVRQVYTALFHVEQGKLTRMNEDEAISLDDLGARLAALEQPVMLVGDGAELCLRELADQLPGLRICPEAIRHQRAGSVAVLAAQQETTISAQELEPAYLRLPQAQRELLKKQKEQQA